MDNENKLAKVINKDFVIELAKYFMQFLETDFKKRRYPKRNLSSRINKGLSVGLYLDKYPALYKDLYKNIVGGFADENIDVSQKEFITKIPDSLRELIAHRIEKFTDKDTTDAIDDLVELIERARLDNQKQYDNFLEESTEQIKHVLSTDIIVPLVNELQSPLQAAGLSTESGLYQLEVDSVEKIFNIFDGSIESSLRVYYADNQNNDELKRYFTDIFDAKALIKTLSDFFEEFSTSDAYSDIYQLHRNKDMLDKTELYFYFCEISIDKLSFPLFYSPVATFHSEQKISLVTDSRIFVNTKAVEFIIQEYNAQTGNHESIGNDIDRIFYIDNKKDIVNKMQALIDKLSEMLDIDSLDIKNYANQSKSNIAIKLNNRLQLFLFDKSDEALINDYEEIIQDNGDLAGSFSDLINGFISENPIKLIEEVAEEWDEKSIPDKLVIQSPIPLNEEQKQVMLALQKDDCNIVILEGPPGTGKSHTITAIVCKALLNGQSVLVLSDKDEALDVVQDKITETLNTIRHDKNFQNPILRLGKSGGGLAKVIDGQALDRVREHYRAYKTKNNEFSQITKEYEERAIEELDKSLDFSEQIKLSEIIKLEGQSAEYEKYGWVDPKDAMSINTLLLESHEAANSIAKSESGYLIRYINNNEISKIPIFLEILQKYDELKVNVDQNETKFINAYKALDEKDKISVRKKLESTAKNSTQVIESLSSSGLTIFENLGKGSTFEEIYNYSESFSSIREISYSAVTYLGDGMDSIFYILDDIRKHDLDVEYIGNTLQEYVNDLKSTKSKLFGFAGKSGKLDEMQRNIKKKLPYFNLSNPEKQIPSLQLTADLLLFIGEKMVQKSIDKALWNDIVSVLLSPNGALLANDIEKIAPKDNEASIFEYKLNESQKLLEGIDLLLAARSLLQIAREQTTINNLIGLTEIEKILTSHKEYILKLQKLNTDYEKINAIKENKKILSALQSAYPDTAEKLGLDGFDAKMFNEQFLNMDNEGIKDYLDYLVKMHNYELLFDRFNYDEYSVINKELETLTTAKMAHLLDTRIIEYVDRHGSDIRTLKSLLRSKQKFPKTLFGGLKQAFPCILAGIRDYATYIPLEKNLFDLVIIDEASQVSIAQALPALIRGKKVLVLGDDKQFSNVKAGNASKLTNDQLKNQVINSLRESLSGYDRDTSSVFLSRAKDNFDIKNSVLEFCRFISNYEIMLKKHFRCYPEIIAYSNEKFYGGELQCMKARALPIGEVIKFEYVKHDGIKEKYLNINTPELEYIMSELQSMKDRDFKGSIGVITPHREQATYISTELNTSDLSSWLDERRLKVMTFDTCQGEERDYIFYSMVANDVEDKHRYVFPQSLEGSSDEEESNVRKQRLNVGFSRAKETIHFVLSKPVDQYWGEVRSALSFYTHKLTDTSGKFGGTDPTSGMEAKIQHYFHETRFYKDNSDNVELIPQFPLGDYIRSMDRTYHHPDYKVDFLMTFGKEKYVIEYDGFKEHFIDTDGINEQNHMSYLKPEDVYRQKVLEGYGYKFIRLNKFNLKKDPVNELDAILANSVKKKTKARVL